MFFCIFAKNFRNIFIKRRNMGKLALYKYAYFLSIVLTFGLTVITISGALAGNVSPKLNMFMTVVGLALPVLLIVNVVVLLYWLIRRRVWCILPLVALLANWHYISATIQISASGESPDGYMLKVMTLNARNFVDDDQDDSVDEIKNFIDDESINVVCFQEYRDYVTGRPERISNFFSSIFPYRAVSGSVAIFSKFPILAKDYVTFRESNNCAQWVDLETERGKSVRVFNVHMQTTGVNSALHQAAKMERQGIPVDNGQRAAMVTNRMGYEYIRRAEQADILSDIVKETNVPMVLCGDFNDTPASYTYKRLKGRMKDGFKSAGKGYMYTYRGAKGWARIDYIFHSESLGGVRYYSPEKDWSDHNPVIMEMNMPQ